MGKKMIFYDETSKKFFEPKAIKIKCLGDFHVTSQ